MSIIERRHFDKAFKLEAINMIKEQGYSVTEAADKIGVHENTLYKWLRQFKADPEYAFPGSGNLKPEEDELRKLKRENANLREENEILKKAMAIFTKHPK